jgi:hypothetical protein
MVLKIAHQGPNGLFPCAPETPSPPPKNFDGPLPRFHPSTVPYSPRRLVPRRRDAMPSADGNTP